MAETVNSRVKINSRGRMTLPKGIMEALDLKSGNGVMIFLRAGRKRAHIILAGDDEILARGKQAEEDFASGKTRDIREYARERGIDV